MRTKSFKIRNVGILVAYYGKLGSEPWSMIRGRNQSYFFNFYNPSYSLMRANPNMYLMNAFRYWWTSFSTFYWCLWTYGFESTEASNLRLSGVTLYENRDQSVHALSKELDQLLALETSKTGKS